MSSLNVRPLRNTARANVPPTHGKLVRQTGRSNLIHDKAQDISKPVKEAPISVVPESTSTFEVFCDSPVADDKNIIHQLEKQEFNEKKRRALSTITTAFPASHGLQSKLYAVPTKSFDTVSCATSVYEDACSSVYGSALESPSRPISPSDEHASSNNHEVNVKCATSDEYFVHSDYSQDIYVYMREREVTGRPNPRYMTKQTDINGEMRSILVDWLADVCCEYNLQLDTLCSAVLLIDRMLCLRMVSRLKLQLVGTAALMIASKVEEIFPPELKEFIYVTDETYTAEQIIKMEKLILTTLGWEISSPLVSWFASRLAHIADLDKRADLLVSYLTELTLIDLDYLQFLPSVVGAAAVCAARIICGASEPWTEDLYKQSELAIEEIMPCVRAMLKSFRDAPHASQTGMYEKYADQLRFSVATMPCPVEQCADDV